ncbi:MAG: hypothetical protein HY695_11250 [Deltaproteobacteria bacterium]|nr:hypothetical protein [Deltaproteobacteria bacterium]
MAAFASFAEAEARAKTLMDEGYATVAHACLLVDGTLAVRLLRPMSATGSTGDGMNKAGAWDTVTDNAAT